MTLRGSIALVTCARDLPHPGTLRCHCGAMLPSPVFTHHRRIVQVRCHRCGVYIHCHAEID